MTGSTKRGRMDKFLPGTFGIEETVIIVSSFLDMLINYLLIPCESENCL